MFQKVRKILGIRGGGFLGGWKERAGYLEYVFTQKNKGDVSVGQNEETPELQGLDPSPCVDVSFCPHVSPRIVSKRRFFS